VKFRQWLELVALLICLYIFWQIRNILLLTLTAVVFTVILNRAVSFLKQWLPSRKATVVVVLSIVFLFLGITGIIIIPPFVQQLQELADLMPQIVDRIQQWFSQIERLYSISIQGFQSIESILNQLRNFDLEMVFGQFFTLFSNTLSATLNGLLVFVLTIMMLINPTPYRRLFVKAFPGSIRQRVNKVLDNCERAIADWFIGIIFNMVVIATMSMIGLSLLDIPLAFANSLLAGLLAFIPNIGPVVSVIPPTAIALLEAPWKAIAVILLYILIQQLESNILTPLVMQRQVSLLPAITLLSQVIFAVFFGFLGLLLALPLTLISQQWLAEFWIGESIDGDQGI